ncbi:hypothetical protein JZ785_02715 [Alicyclobacillus curvatus]|nr:hypothetical protein JZ785_02715 [Alicyclobacillus curvatus]
MDFIRRAAPTLRSVYSAMYIAVSDETAKDVRIEVERGGFATRMVPKAGAANARRDALRFAGTTSFEYFHYCDLDRMLTWALNYPDELRQIKDEIIKHDYTVLGRTERAFHTHPESWVKTETITNHICSLELGFDVDITAGSCGFSSKSLHLILQHSESTMTDAEWAMIVRRIGKGSVGYRRVEGLEYVEDINGRPLSTQLDANSWLGRLRLSYLISEPAISTGN